jgi:hypothetical protein
MRERIAQVASAILDIIVEVEILCFHHEIDNWGDRGFVGQEYDMRIILKRHIL